jgi:ABC-type antimicrobial peptide transport system permease subunit
MNSMTVRRFLVVSLRYHWRASAAVLLCVAVGTTVLGGALLVGDSMRGSLRELTLDRLGKVDYALSSSRLFHESLSKNIATRLTPMDGKLPEETVQLALRLTGNVAKTSKTAAELGRVRQVQVWGVDEAFWRLSRSGAVPSWANEWSREQRSTRVVINMALATELNVRVGDEILVGIEKPTEIPREAVLGRKDELVRTLRVVVGHIATASDLGSFGLDATQRSPRNVFLPLESLAGSVGQHEKANTILISVPPGERVGKQTIAALQTALAQSLELKDLGLRLRINRDYGYAAVESDRMMLEPPIANAVQQAAAARKLNSSPAITYLANSISVRSREIPYSIVAAVRADDLEPFRLPALTGGDELTGLADDEILINTWAAEDLDAQPGDQVTLTYFVAEPATPFETTETRFRVRGVVPISGAAADRDIVPRFRGITDATTFAQWDPPFPMDLKRIRPRDEEYWEKHRTTPKAFVSLATGERLWGSRFGVWTSIRLAPNPQDDLHINLMTEQFTWELFERLRPEQVGLQFQPVKAQGLESSRGGTDFGQLFLAFSFFLIVSAAILIALVFRLSVERRAKQVGLLLAVGFTQAGVRMLLLAEGLIVAAMGSVVGVAGAVGYAWLVMAGLRTWWLPAVGTTLLRLHVPPATLAIGAAAGLVLAAAAIFISLRGLVRLTPRALLAGTVTEPLGRPRPTRVGNVVRWSTCSACAVVLFITFVFFKESAVMFFLTGAVLLVALLSFVAERAGRDHGRMVRGGGWWAIARLGVRNAHRHRGRSVLTAGLVAFATFVIVAVGANRRDESAERTTRGGDWLVAESAIPLLHDLNTPTGRRELGLPDDSFYWLSNVKVSRFRLKEGEDASCLNLYQPKRPRILGVPDETLKQVTFGLSDSLKHGRPSGKPIQWHFKDENPDDDVIPAIGDANSVKWILHLGLGDRLPIEAEDGRTVDLQIDGLLERSVFQGELLISESSFRRLFPSVAGYSYFLVQPDRPDLDLADRPAGATSGDASSPSILTLLETHLSDYGFDATPVADRIAEYHAVENTYLATFQMLGGLGLVLGTLGLGAVLLRGAMERRGELALLLAVGFRPAALAWLVLAETAFLLVAGLAIGTISAGAAVAPHLIQYAGEVPWLSLAGTLLFVLAIGLMSSGAAVLATLRTPLLPALRSE